MNKSICLILLAACASSPVWAGCNYPTAPAKLPDGNTATRDEMVAANKLVKQYNVDMNAYLACIKSEYDASAAKATDATEQQKQQMAAMYTQKNDAAVDELQGVANRFNEQLRAFKAKTPK